jgi:hypothetical protein
VGIGGAPAAGYKVLSTGTWTGGTTFFGCASQGTIQSDVTAAVYTYRSAPNTAAASFTLTNLIHYIAEGSAVIGAGSAITTQQGFSAASNLTTATNNYGFYGNIPAATGRYNLYMVGTADNYLAGKLGIGAAPSTSTTLTLNTAATGNVSQYGVYQGNIIQSDVTTQANYFTTSVSTQAATFTVVNLRHYQAVQGTFGLNSSVTTQSGYSVNATVISATNNYAFTGTIPSGTGRYNLYMGGTADNYLGGPLITAGLKATSAAAPTIASATTIAPTTQIAFISGTTAIATITAPSPISLGGGQITLIPTGIFTTTTAGNIALASTAVVGKALIMTYDATTTKWYPSY